MDLPTVEKAIPTISMDSDNQIVLVKVNNSKDNMNSSRHVNRWLKYVRKLKISAVIALDHVHKSKNLIDQFSKGVSHNVTDGASKKMSLRPT